MVQADGSCECDIGYVGVQCEFCDAGYDGYPNCAVSDADGDGVPDSLDNCPAVANPDQADQNQDGLGDRCDLSTLNDRIAELEAELDLLTQAMAGLVDDLATCQDQVQTDADTILALQSELANLQADLFACGLENTQLSDRLAEAQTLLAAAEAELSTCQDTNAQHLARIAVLEQELAECDGNLASCEATSDAQAADINRLTQEVSDLTAGMAALEAQLAGYADTSPPFGVVHAYHNYLSPPNNKLVDVEMTGRVFDALSAAHDGGGNGVAAAWLTIDGDWAADLVLGNQGEYSVVLQLKAKRGAHYLIELHATDTKSTEQGGPNSAIVDTTTVVVHGYR